MSGLARALEEYLATRRSLGFTLRLPASALRNFVAFMEDRHAPYVTTELALRWAKQPRDVQPSTWSWRLAMVRRFAVWQAATDPRTQVPPNGLLTHRYRRKPPYIYTDEEITKIIVATAKLPSAGGLRAQTYSTLFGLLAVTGLRVNEALGLDCRDVDFDQGILTIRRAKFGKSRLVPLHPSTRNALVGYAETRDRMLATPMTHAFFVSERGTRITEWSTRYSFAKVSRQIGLRSSTEGGRHGHGPRLHDMRHRFAVRTLVEWYRAGLDVEREIPKLATYLGHVHINDTYWYLEAVPELLELATERLIKRPEEVGS